MYPMQVETLVHLEAKRLAHAAEHEPVARPTRWQVRGRRSTRPFGSTDR
jgi:hypothetical protein